MTLLTLRMTNPKGYRKLVGILKGMKQRCYNPNNKGYEANGAKGITVCDEWRQDSNKFYTWMLDNGYNPSDGAITADTLSMTRIDPTKGYSPDNCKLIPVRDIPRFKHIQKSSL